MPENQRAAARAEFRWADASPALRFQPSADIVSMRNEIRDLTGRCFV